MMRLYATVGVLGLGLGVAVAAPPAEPGPSELVARLGSEDFRERESAGAALERCGADALPALREGARASDPEVRQRAALILAKVQRSADSAGRLVAKKVALNYRDAPLGTVLADLKTRTGLNLAPDLARIADPLRKVTCVTGEVPVWEALEAFCTAAGLRETFSPELDVPKVQTPGRRGYTPPAQIPNPEAVPIVLIDGTGPSLPGSRHTAVRVVALPPSFPGHRVTLGTGETTLCFDVTPAPGLNWQDVLTVRITKLTDDAGRAGAAGVARPEASEAPEFNGFIAVGGGWRFVGGFGGGRFDPRTGMPLYPESMPNPRVIPVPLKLATQEARKIKRLEGSVVGELVLSNQPLVTVTEPEKHAGSTFEGPGQVRLTVVAVGEPKGAAGSTLQVTLHYPPPWNVGSRRGWNPGGIWPEAPRPGNQTPVLTVFDAAGKAMNPQRNVVTPAADFDGTSMQMNLTMQFAKDAGAPAKLVLAGPRPVIVEVPFALENVPLP